MTVSDFIKDQLKSYEEDKQDYMVYICDNGFEVTHEWIENFKNKMPQYLSRTIVKIEYFTEAAYVHI